MTNVKTLRQYKSRFSLIVEQILAFTWSNNFVREVKICLQISHELHNDVCVIDNSHSDRQVHFIVTL